MHAAEVLEAYLKECFAVAKVGDGVKGLEMVFPGNLTWFY